MPFALSRADIDAALDAAVAAGLPRHEERVVAEAAAILAGCPELGRAVRDALIAADPGGVVEALPVPTNEQLDATAYRLGYRNPCDEECRGPHGCPVDGDH